jgi:integrase
VEQASLDRPLQSTFGATSPNWGRFQESCAPALRPKPHLDTAWLMRAEWPDFWDAAQRELRSVGLRTGTLRVDRQVLRHFRTFLCARGAGTRPGCATPALAREFLYRLSDRHASWSWTATHITALRTVFDKLGGAAITNGMVTPKRPRRLPDILEPDEVGQLLEAAGSTRDRLAILLLYGCGLKTSELCALRWTDVDITGRAMRVRFAGGTRERRVLLPTNAIPLLQAESCYRQGSDPVFSRQPRHKSAKPDVSGRSPATGPEGRIFQSKKQAQVQPFGDVAVSLCPATASPRHADSCFRSVS